MRETQDSAVERVASPDDGEHLRLVVEATPIAIVVVDERGAITLANTQAQLMFGYPAAELLGKSVDMLVPERFRKAHPDLRGGYLGAPVSRPMGEGRDLFGLRRDGSEVPIEIGLNPLRTPQGMFVLAAIIDLTERIRSEEQLRLVVEAAPNAMILTDAAGHITLVNTAVERLFGYERNELLGKSVDELVPERFRHGHPRLRHDYAVAPTTRAMGAGRDLFGLRKDGREVPIEIGLNPISTPLGQFVLASIIDITERKHAEELRLANAGILQHATELEALNAELESFSYSVSHDLRAPVRAVLGYTRAIQEDYDEVLDDEGRRLLGVVHSEASRMGDLIDDLLTFSRLGRQAMQSGPVNMTSLVRDVVTEQVRLAGARESIFEIADLPGVDGDRVLLRQVWANLISNAIKYSSKQPEPQVRIWATLEPARAIFHVRDNGVGFDMKYADKLFGVFQRLHRSDEFAGTGVGLAIVQRIVRRHSGSVWADARLGEGATFSFAVPIGGSA